MKKPSLPTWATKIEYDNKNCKYKNAVLHLEPEQAVGYIRGDILAERMKEKGLSASVLDYLLEHPEEIPDEWKKNKDGDTNFIYFWGTIYRNSDGYLYVRCLYFYEGHWRRDYSWLDGNWVSRHPSAVSASTKNSDTKTSLEPLNLELAIKICKENGYKIIKEI